ncbi:MAG: GyrI-like domain-containing protein [Bacteroidota bacterium]
MNRTTLETFKIVGLSVRTTNENGQAATDIPALWSRFFAEEISSKITHKLSDDMYCMYTDYEKDHTKPYTTILGYKVDSGASVPEGLTAKTVEAHTYDVIPAKGKMSEGFVFQAWQKIWNSDMNRTYTADFEVYGSKAWDPENAEIEIYIAVK